MALRLREVFFGVLEVFAGLREVFAGVLEVFSGLPEVFAGAPEELGTAAPGSSALVFALFFDVKRLLVTYIVPLKSVP